MKLGSEPFTINLSILSFGLTDFVEFVYFVYFDKNGINIVIFY